MKTKRIYQVYKATDRFTKKIIEFTVSDRLVNETENERPAVVTFPVCMLYDEIMQRKRAFAYCDYLNQLLEETEKVHEQAQLIAVLKS